MVTGGTVRTNLATFIREQRHDGPAVQGPGPYLTISRQYGCQGYFLGTLLVDLLTTDPLERHSWRIFSRDILTRLAGETDLTADMINRLRREEPHLLREFLRGLGDKHFPGVVEVRDRITEIVKAVAFEGHAIIIGMGGAGASQGIPNGMHVRLEAPLEWRIARIMEGEGVGHTQAAVEIQQHDRDSDRLRQIYRARYRYDPPFDLVYDCSSFSLSQIAQHVAIAMKLKDML